MNTNLDKIALDLYGKIETRFKNIKMGDEHGEVLSKKTEIPNARFFEFEYKEDGERLGTIAITLDEDDGIIVEISGDLADSRHRGAFRFIRSFRQFAKNRLLNFDVQNIGKDNLDKRDYEFKAKPKEETMSPIMENKLYGNARMSYQDLGEARLVIKHSQPVNTELAAGRSMHIEAIYVENADGERFKYPYKHINGARALAEHIKAGGNPYDSIGKYIGSLSEELVQLRKFKSYVGRNDTLSEAMDDISVQVAERIEAVKKEVNSLQRPAYYQAFAESFEANESQDIPEEILNDWIDRLTIRTFNEELKTAFPYIYRLVGESGVPVKELHPEDFLDEVFDGDKETGTTHKGGKVTKTSAGVKHEKTDYDDEGQRGRKVSDTGHKNPKYKYPVPDEDLDEERTETKNEKGEVVSWKDESDWRPVEKNKHGNPKDPRGRVTNTAGKARRETEKMANEGEFANVGTNSGTPEGSAYFHGIEDGKSVQANSTNKPRYNNPSQWGEYFKDYLRGFKDASALPRGGRGGGGGGGMPGAKPDMPQGMMGGTSIRGAGELAKESIQPEDYFENFMDNLMNEGDDEYGNGIFDENPSVKKDALQALNDCFKGDAYTPGMGGINLDKLTKLVPDPMFIQKIETLKQETKDSSDKDVTAAIEYIMGEVALENDELAEILENGMINFNGSGDDVGGEEPTEPPADIAPAPAAPEAPPAPDASAAPAPEAVPPTPAPVAEDTGSASPLSRSPLSKIKAKLIQAKECGATLETVMDFGHKAMTLHDAMRECGIDPRECGFEGEDVFQQMKDLASGFFNREEGNTTIGPTRILIKAAKEFPDHFDESGNPVTPEAQQFAELVNKIDPMSPTPKHGDLDRIKHLAGVGHNIDETPEEDDFSGMMKQFMDKHQGTDINQMLSSFAKAHPDAKISQTNTSSGTINGKPANYDDAMNQFKNMKLKFGDQEIDPSNPQAMQGQIGNMMKGMMSKAQGQAPNQNIQFPGGQMNPADMMKDIMGKINFGN